jgi:hypothetical protein
MKRLNYFHHVKFALVLCPVNSKLIRYEAINGTFQIDKVAF